MRVLIYFLIAGLIVSLGLLGARLQRDLDTLYQVDTNGMIWTVFQIEAELATLRSTLAEQAATAVPDSSLVRLRTDIVLSRISLLRSGRSRSFWEEISEAEDLLGALERYAQDAARVIDHPGALDQDDITALSALTGATRPQARRLAVLGVATGATASEARRAIFVQQLERTGFVAFVLVAGLTVVLLYLDRLLLHARRRDADLRVSSQKLASTVAASLDGIIVTDRAWRIVDYNEAAQRIFGWSKDEVVGRRLNETVLPSLGRGEESSQGFRLPQTGTSRMEATAARKSGVTFPVELNVTTSTKGDGTRIAYFRDISEQKISERHLIDARNQAERTDRAKSQFLAVMSHEMRTPLNGILGVLDLLKTTRLDVRQRRFVDVAAASGEILLEHVNEAIDITRIETGAISLTPQGFALPALVARVTDVLRPLASEKGLTLVAEISPDMDRSFFADSGRISQILTNLLGNAIKFTDAGQIHVDVSGIHGPERSQVTFRVSDTGPGITPERLDDIFEDYVVLARSEGRQSRGDGLGLAISRRVARLMGGDLKAESTLGEGSVFTLSVPLERMGEAPLAPPPSPAKEQRPKSVLIVEDNQINRSVLREMLVGFGHSVYEAENGREGVAAAGERRFDLIVMDFRMPVMDGIAATRELRGTAGPNRGTYILGLTAYGSDEYRALAEDAGMDGFCTKPLRLSVLEDTLSRLEHFPAPRPAWAGSVDQTYRSGLQEETLSGLERTLGQDELRSTLAQFLKEFEEALSRWRRPGEDRQELLDDLHRLRGASVLFGLNDLAELVDMVSAGVDDGTTWYLEDALSALEAELVSTSATFADEIGSANLGPVS
ncbi:MAG: ATP-binding protein [Pseudomonadota bacterium]